MHRPSSRWLLFLVVTLLLLPAQARTQAGMVTGVVTERGTTVPLASARVELRTDGGTVVAGTLSDTEGRFRLLRIEPGTYTLVAHMIGYRDTEVTGVRVTADAPTNVAVALPVGAFALNPVVVSASRRQEKVLEAPAMVALVNTTQIESRPAITPVDHVRNVPGLDVIQQGIQSTNVVARGFNNIFSTTLHTLTDYRLASIPSLRVNLLHFVPSNNEDIERIEVVLGPGAALYGPNTSSGVLHMITKSPLHDQGTVVSMAGGERGVLQGSFRTAHLLTDNLGIKLSGQYLQGDEWRISPTDPSAVDEGLARALALQTDPNTKIGLRDYRIQRYAAEARADWQATDETTAVFSAGYSNAARGIELTGIGAGQTLGWSSSYVQARATHGRLFGQAYVNMSDAGDTYIVSNGLPIIDNSKVAVAQVQHGLALGDRQNFTYGADLVQTMPNTQGTIHGRNEDDDHITEAGAYIQSETSLTSALDLVLAGRLDHHSRLDNTAIFSPRAGLVFTPSAGHSFRATFNRAFSTPVSFNLFLDLDGGRAPDPLGFLGYRIRAMGTEPGGFTFTNPDGSLYGVRSPFAAGAGVGSGPGDRLDVDSAILWKLGVTAVQALGGVDAATADYLRTFNPDIGINVLNPSTLTATPLDQTAFPAVPRAQESRNSTIEVGYNGLLGGRFRVSTGLWYEHRSNFMSPLTPFTPLLRLDSLGIHDTAVGAGMSEAQAGALANTMKNLPVGVVTSPDMEASSNAYILATYRNFGEVSLMGADVSVTALLADAWSLTVGGSIVDKDHFFFRDTGWLVGLNAPRHKGVAALNYHSTDTGVNGEVRMRATGSFPVSSAPYSATACLDHIEVDRALPDFSQPCIPAAMLLDVNMGYRLPMVTGASVQLSITNLLDNPYRSFIGVPEIGRFAMLRLRYEF